MIFFRKKKPGQEPSVTAKKSEPTSEPVSKQKHIASLQEIAHERVLTAEGWRRLMEKQLPKKPK